MNFIRLLPVSLSLVLLGAHFYRGGLVWLTGLCLILLVITHIPKPWVPRLMQIVLLLGAAEWFRTGYYLVAMRMAFDEPWTRLAVILGVVAAFTGLSALVFRSMSLRRFFGTSGD